MGRVLCLWLAQTVSVLGSGLTTFAIAVWAYRQSGSATDVSVIALCGTAPALLAAPFAGALVDRHDRRTLLVLSDLGAGLTALIAAALIAVGHARIATLAPAVALGSLLGSVRQPAYLALVRELVPAAQLGRIGGLVQLGDAGAELVGPAAGGLLFVALGLAGVLVADVATFVAAIAGVLLATAGARGATTAAPTPARRERLDLAGGWRYLAARPGTLALLGFYAAWNLLIGIATTLATPLLLSSGGAAMTGLALTVGGTGMIAGSLVIGAWGGPRRPIRFILLVNLVVGAAIAAGGARPTLPVFLVASFVAYGGIQLAAATVQGYWLRTIEPAMHGRVFALRRMIPYSTLPVAYAIAGPIADRTGVVPAYLGAGVGFVLVTLVALAHPRVRALDAAPAPPLHPSLEPT